jgi:hypothetical protein
MEEQEIIWRPQPGRQKALIDCPVYEIFYGGARGGGKTDGVIGKMGIKALKYGSAFNCVFFRKEIPMLDDAISRSHQIYEPIGGQWVGYKKTWQFPGGGRLRFRPLEKDSDAEKYQGQNLSDVCIEEVGTYGDYNPIAKLHGAIRSGGGVPTQMHMTGNPGGAGQGWLKERFVDPNSNGFQIINEKFPNGAVKQRVYIPALVTDNKILMNNDPGYITNLYMVGSDALVKAWLEGDWNAVEGAYFDKFSTQRHVIKPFKIPHHWYRIRAFDWGYSAPFCALWLAVADGSLIEYDGQMVRFPKGALICYREWYGAEKANVGLRLENKEIAKGILEREISDKIDDMVADPAIFAHQGGTSIAEQMSDEKIHFRPADNKRIPGWQQIRQRLDGDNGIPMLYITSNCSALIRTISIMQHDKTAPEDLDTTSEDHAVDTLRYGCMARPYTRIKIDPPKEWDARIHVQDIVKQLRQQEKRRSFK